MYAVQPEALPTYDGCIEFKGRLFLWGDPEFPNRLRYSAFDRPDVFSGDDSGYTDPFGDMSPIKMVRKFYNELIIWKEDSVWMLEGYSPANFGTLKITDTIGIASPHSAQVTESGHPGMHTNEVMSVAIWQAIDGVYLLDGRKVKKTSFEVDNYFNPEYATCIAAASIANRQAFVDFINNEYHLLLPTSELVYNYSRNEWFPPWERDVDLVSGVSVKGSNGRFYTYGGSAAGRVMLLESDTTDKNAANADVKITQKIKTRAISAEQRQATTLEFMFRKVWIEAKARTTPSTKTLVVTYFADLATTGVAIATPAALDLGNSGYSLATPQASTTKPNNTCFQLEFKTDTADLELEIWSFLYWIMLEGVIE
jgi:hypothetical protein